MENQKKIAQRQLIWLVSNDARFLETYRNRIKPEFFGNVGERWLINIVLRHFDTFTSTLSRLALAQYIDEAEVSGELNQLQLEPDDILALWDSAIGVSSGDRDFVVQKVDDFLEFARTALALRRAATRLKEEGPAAAWEVLSQEEADTPNSAKLLWGHEVTERPVKWLWQDRILQGGLTIVAGDMDVGKSTLLYKVAACVTTGKTVGGRALPGNVRSVQGKVLVLTSEAGAQSIVVPRIRDLGGDVSQLAIHLGTQDGKSTLKFDHDMAELASLLRQHQFRLVIVDPLDSYLGKVDSWKSAEVRRVVDPLNGLAAQFDCAIVGIKHFTKGARDKAIYRPQGATSVMEAARVALFVIPDPEEPTHRLVFVPKHNLSGPVKPLAFTLEREEDDEDNDDPLATGARFRWINPREDVDLEDLMRAKPRSAQPSRRKLQDALDHIQATLMRRPRPATIFTEWCDEQGVSPATLKRAKSELNVESRKLRSVWYWGMPDKPENYWERTNS